MFFLSFVPFYPDENIWILIFLVLVTNPLAFHIFVVKLIRCTYMHIGTRKDLKNTQSWKVQNCVCCSQFLFFILTRSLLLPWIQVEMEFNFDFWRILLKLDVHHCLDLSSYVQLLLEPLKQCLIDTFPSSPVIQWLKGRNWREERSFSKVLSVLNCK